MDGFAGRLSDLGSDAGDGNRSEPFRRHLIVGVRRHAVPIRHPRVLDIFVRLPAGVAVVGLAVLVLASVALSSCTAH